MTIALRNPVDFVEHVEAMAVQINKNDEPRPMSANEVSAPRLQRWRDGREETVALPPSRAALLRIDRDFSFWNARWLEREWWAKNEAVETFFDPF